MVKGMKQVCRIGNAAHSRPLTLEGLPDEQEKPLGHSHSNSHTGRTYSVAVASPAAQSGNVDNNSLSWIPPALLQVTQSRWRQSRHHSHARLARKADSDHSLRLLVEKQTTARCATVEVTGVGAIRPCPWTKWGDRRGPVTPKPHNSTYLLRDGRYS